MTVDDPAGLHADLLAIRSEAAPEAAHADLVAAAWPRIRTVLELLPDAARTGSILELGASPYLQTIALRRQCRGRLALANWFGDASAPGSARLVDSRSGEAITLAYDQFDAERDRFPYDDAQFDVVVFCELLEHLSLDPVATLAEIHRVLRPGGTLIVSTPNALSLFRLEVFLRAGSTEEARYFPGFGPGARHNREYHAAELRELLDGVGFQVETLGARDLRPVRMGIRRSLIWAGWRWVLRRYADVPREEHLFARARRGERFRWRFPPRLFDPLKPVLAPRDAALDMGFNDEIHCAGGWSPPPAPADGRIIEGRQATVVLRAPAGATALRITLGGAAPASASLGVRVRDRWMWRRDDAARYADVTLPVTRELVVPLTPTPEPGTEVEIVLEPDARLAVRRLALES
jgi:SAM-dependent methyltransferase